MASASEQVVESLDARQSFIVEAGAGSGKTRTLVESLSYLLGTRAGDFLSGNQQIVCITCTNVAANEILARINRDPLVRVSTIHDFLWSVIRGFQSELREGILVANSAAEPKKRIEDLDLAGMTIEYWQYPRKWAEGKLHHDDIVSLSAWMFSTYPKLARLVADRYPIIFVDEYQDTHESTIQLLLDVLVEGNSDRLTVGLFGDHMQKIYDRGVGKVDRPSLRVIQKQENYRCSLAVIELLNQLRPSLQQVPGNANVQGSARFFKSTTSTAASGMGSSVALATCQAIDGQATSGSDWATAIMLAFTSTPATCPCGPTAAAANRAAAPVPQPTSSTCSPG